MQDMYRVLNLRSKLESGQAVLERRKLGDLHIAEYGDEVRSETLNIKLAINNYRICVAHRYLKPDGSPHTEPDPKHIHVDELKLYFDPEA